MPLRDHFRPPVTNIASWEELHGLWPGLIAIRLNNLLPPEYRSGVKIHLGNAVEIDVAAFDLEHAHHLANGTATETALAWEPASPTLLLDTAELTPPEYEVQVYDQRKTRRLVAAVEIVSPRNKDRPDSRDAFVSKCHALLQQDVCVAIIDPVTERGANLYAALAARLGAEPPSIAGKAIYAVSCRSLSFRDRYRVEAWEHGLEIGAPLPTLPLWLNESRYVPLELERTYEETCRGLRIA
jgi:hypothetical protein